MAIKATERKVSEGFSLKIGVMEFLPVALNPSKEELEELLGGKELEYDPEYLSEDGDGNNQLRLDVWGKDIKTNSLHKIQLYLKDKLVEIEKENDGKTVVNKQFVNTKGFQAWTTGDEDDLPAYFLKGAEAHQAREGEADLLNFIASWIFVEEINLEWKKLMKGNIKDLKELLSIGKSVVVTAGVKTSDKDGETKQKQVYFTRSFLPGSYYKEFAAGKFTEAYINTLKKKAEENKEAKKSGKAAPHKLKQHEYFALSVTNEKGGFKAFYGQGLLPLRDYDPSADITASDEVLQEASAEDDSDY